MAKLTTDKKYEIIYDVNKAILVNDDGREVITDDFTYDEIIKTHEWRGKTIHALYPIRALRDFGNVRKGDLGGCIASENNLSQEGDCWVTGNARVFGNARVSESAIVNGGKIFGNAHVYGNARVIGNVKIYDIASVYDNAYVHALSGCIHINGDNARIYGYTEIDGDDEEDCIIISNSFISGKSLVCGCGQSLKISGEFILSDAYICDNNDFVIMKGIGVYYDRTSYPAVFYKNINSDITVNYEGFIGTLKEFRRRVIKKCSPKSQNMLKEHLMALEMVKLHFE